MRLLLTGGTGFIGSALRESLTHAGYEVLILTRQASRENQPGLRTRYSYWNPPHRGAWEKELEGVEGVINLAGEPIVGKRWTQGQKQKILESRVGTTQALVEAIRHAKRKPSFLLTASAIGYYGPHGSEELTEGSPPGKDFLSQVCQAWEAQASRVEELGLRLVRLRIGLVLEKGGGAISKMLPPFQWGLGGPLGTGRQWMSWIHRKDLVGLIHFAFKKKEVRGPLNATAPHPVLMKEFAQTLGAVLHRPAFFPVPGFVLKTLLGEMAEIVLTGQRVLPKRALELGYSFQFPRLEAALEGILQK